MIPVWPAVPFDGFRVNRVWIVAPRNIEPIENDQPGNAIYFSLYLCVGDQLDLLGDLNTEKQGMEAYVPYDILSSPQDMRAMHVLAISAVRGGAGAPRLRGFAVQVDYSYVGV